MHKICILCILALLTVSCASSGQVNSLSNRVWEQEERQRRMQNQLEAMDQELTRMLGELEAPMRTTQANLWAEIESLRTQTATMMGQMEEVQRAVKGGDGVGAMADLTQQVGYLDRSVTMIASQLALDLGPRPKVGPGARTDEFDPASRLDLDPTAVPDDPTQRARPPVDDPAQALYENALQAFHARNYTQAQRLWDEFARTFPQHELVSNAIFWQGESYFQMGDYAQAVLAYLEA